MVEWSRGSDERPFMALSRQHSKLNGHQHRGSDERHASASPATDMDCSRHGDDHPPGSKQHRDIRTG